ncbi:hypothetical protein HHX47_DHR8000004 [Lentinula edodes]|nr:hypothetical protein HHX47_DHR8000004 [Lentinula edodes]
MNCMLTFSVDFIQIAMSSALFTAVTTTLKGDNYDTWASEMEAFLQATGLESAITTDQPSEPSPLVAANAASVEAWKNYEVVFKAWKEIDTKAIGNIRLRISPSIRILAKEYSDTAKKLWNYLAKTYNVKSLGAVFNDFAAAMAIKIPYKQNPLSSMMEIGMYFTRMDEAGIGLADHLEALILLSKLPSRYSVVVQTMSQLETAELKKLTFAKVRIAVMNAFSGDTIGNSQPQNANKFSNVHRKGNDPKFSQQQHGNGSNQQQKGQNGNDDNKKKRKRGSGKNKKAKKNANAAQADADSMDFSPIGSTVDFGPVRTDLTPSVQDVRKHSIHPPYNPPPNATSLHLHKKTRMAIKRARDIGVRATAEVIRTLEPAGHISELDSDDELDPPTKRTRAMSPVDDVENGSKAPTPPPPSPPMDFEVPGTASFDPDELMNFDLDREILAITGFMDTMGSVPSSDLDHMGYTNAPSLVAVAKTCKSAFEPDLLSRLYNYRIDAKYISNEHFCVHDVSYSVCKKCKGKQRNQPKWWMNDSGCSEHTTFDLSDFIEYEDLEEKVLIATATTTAYITGVGTVLINFKDVRGRMHSARIAPVFYMKELSHRLIAQGRFLQDGKTVRGNADKVDFWDKDGLFLSFEPRTHSDTIYILKDYSPQPMAVNLVIHSVDYTTMHRRMGHPSREALTQLRKHAEGVPTFSIPHEEDLCEGCAKGKMTLRPFPPTNRRASRPFEIIHSDLKEWPTISYHKYKYTIFFIDDYTSHGFYCHLKKKSGALPVIKQFIATVKNLYETNVKEWMSDGGGEFRSNALDEFFKNEGIKAQWSSPHIHQQNGRAERFIRTIIEKSEPQRFQACIPDSWWEFSVAHAVHVYNRTPMRRHKWKTPYEILYNKVPRIDHLRVFGCGAYVYLHEEIRTNKQSPRSELMTYLGVSDGGHGNIYMRSNNAMFTATHAVFDEKLFPRCKSSERHRSTRLPDRNPDPKDPIPPPGDDDVPIFHQPTTPQMRQDPEQDVAPPVPAEQPARDPSPPPQPRNEQPPAQEQLRRSGRVRRPPTRLTGDPRSSTKLPTEQQVERPKRDIQRRAPQPGSSSAEQERPEPEQVPGPSTEHPTPENGEQPSVTPGDEANTLIKLCREGGAELIYFLMAKAVPFEGELKSSENVREWTYKDITRLPKAEREEWLKACQEELEALKRRGTFELMDRPADRKVIKNRWVFDIKSDGRKKARLVVKGFSQIEGLDYDQVFSPVVRFETVRLLLALTALNNWYLTGLDVRNAYLYGVLHETIYMEQPEGFRIKGKEDKVLLLRKALYGLKQAGLVWWRTLDSYMKTLGFKRLSSDAGIFIRRGKDGSLVIAIIYVDDALFAGPDKKLVDSLKGKFMSHWECRDLGEAKEFLRMRINRHGKKIYIDQCAYLDKVLKRCGMENAKMADTPLPAGFQPEPTIGQSNSALRSKFQMVIGSLLYLMLGTRPDISFAVTKLAQHAANPSQEHLNKALYICRYLLGTRSYALCYDGESGIGLSAWTDSDWASDPYTRRSQTGFFMKLANGIFSWTSHAQKTIAHSSTEAEYMALSDCSRQVVWIRNLLEELGYKLDAIPIAGDNQGSIFMASNPVTSKHSKHIDIRYHYIREVVERGLVQVFFVDGSNNPADLFTKNLGRIKFELFRSMLGLEFYSSTNP